MKAFYSESTPLNVIIIAGLLLISFASCTQIENHNEFITGYAGAFGFFNLEQDSTIRINLKAYRFENTHEITATLNSDTLKPFSSTPYGAELLQYKELPKQAHFLMSLKYEGRTLNINSQLLPKLGYEDIHLNMQPDSTSYLLNWKQLEKADYYSIDITETNYSHIIWDSLITSDNQVEISRNILDAYPSVKINVSAVRGPHPSKQYFNTEGEIRGRFLLVSHSYIRHHPPAEKRNAGLEKTDENLYQDSLTIDLIMKKLLNRQK